MRMLAHRQGIGQTAAVFGAHLDSYNRHCTRLAGSISATVDHGAFSKVFMKARKLDENSHRMRRQNNFYRTGFARAQGP